MTKFLIAILIAVVGLKLVADDILVYKYATTFKLLHNGESKNEKEDSKDSKKDDNKKENDDKFLAHYGIGYTLLNIKIVLSSLIKNNIPAHGFVDRPYTPPNLV